MTDDTNPEVANAAAAAPATAAPLPTTPDPASPAPTVGDSAAEPTFTAPSAGPNTAPSADPNTARSADPSYTAPSTGPAFTASSSGATFTALSTDPGFTATAAPPAAPSQAPESSRRPHPAQFGTIVWGFILLALCGFVALTQFGPGVDADRYLWVFIGVIAAGVALVAVGIAAAFRR